MRLRNHGFVVAMFLAVIPFSAFADDDHYKLIIKNHLFEPSQLTLPAGKRIELVVDNQDATPEEFESHDLRIEKVIPGNSRATLRIGPLSKGKYGFVGEFNEATAQGTLIVE